MRLKLLILWAALIGVSFCNSYAQDYKCTHDGFSNSNGCQCPTSDLGLSLYSGNTCSSIACANAGVAEFDEDVDKNTHCSCPPGFLGTHCEPVKCVSEDVKSFNLNSRERDVSVIITYDTKFQEQIKSKDKIDDLPGLICSAITDAIGEDSKAKIHFWLIETDVLTNVKKCEDDLKFMISMCEGSCEGNLTTEALQEALAEMGEDSRLIILANEGIADTDSTANLNAIRKKAISMRIQIHSIVLSPRTPNPNSIYFKDGFQLLRDLSESTLGFFITPFDAAGGQKNGKNGMADILDEMMGVFFEYVVLDRIVTTTSSCDQPMDYTVFRTMEEESGLQFWMTINSNGANYNEYDTKWIGLNDQPSTTIDAGYFKAYTIPASTGQIYTVKPYSKMGTKCVPATVMVLAKSNHLARFAITNSTEIDASSPFAFSDPDMTNTLVGHFVHYYHEEHLQSLYLEFTNDKFTRTLYDQPKTRDCQYNAEFGQLACNEGDNTLIRVRDRESGTAVTVQSLYCDAVPKSTKRSVFEFGSAVGEDGEDTDTSLDCHPTVEAKKDGRSMILVAHATNKIYNLFNGNSKSAIKYLNDLAALSDGNHYSNFILNIFNFTDVTNAESADNYPDFKSKLMSTWNEQYEYSKDPDCAAGAPGENRPPFDVVSPLLDVNTMNPLPNSDIIYIVDHKFQTDETAQEMKDLQRTFYNKRLRLIVLILGCSGADFSDSNALKDWNNVATKTGGFAAYFEEPENLNQFLASYVDWVKGETAATIDINSNLQFTFDSMTSTPFQAVKGQSYKIIVNTLPAISEVQVSGDESVALTAEDRLGNSLSVYTYTATIDGEMRVTASPQLYFFYASIRVLEVTDDNFATLGFTESKAACLDTKAPALNPRDNQFPATVTTADAAVNMTIFDVNGGVFREGETKANGNNYAMDYNWRCSDKENMFYMVAHVKTNSASFSRAIPTQCFGTGSDADKCIHGEYKPASDVVGSTTAFPSYCECPHDYTGEFCEIPVCQNGGSVTASLECDCTENYEGDFCERYGGCKSADNFVADYKSIANTIIFLVERSKAVVEKMQKIIPGTNDDDVLSQARAAQYIVMQYGNDSFGTEILVSTTDKSVLVSTLTNIKPLCFEYADVHHNECNEAADSFTDFQPIPALTAALEVQITGSAHVFWFASDDRADGMVEDLFTKIGKQRVTISAVFDGVYAAPAGHEEDLTEVTVPAGIHPVQMAGGSIFYYGNAPTANGYKMFFSEYIAPLLQFQPTFEYRPNLLASTTACNAEITVNIDDTCQKLFVASTAGEITISNTGALATTDGTVVLPGGKVFTYKAVSKKYQGAGEVKITLNTDPTTAPGQLCSTTVTAFSQTQVGYGFTADESSTDIAVGTARGERLLVTYWMSEGTDSDDKPTARVTPISAVNGTGETTEVYMTVRDRCGFSLSVPISCGNGVDALEVTITNYILPSGGGNPRKVDKYIPVVCPTISECSIHGHLNDAGTCDCDRHWKGDSCDVNACVNGEIKGEECVCNTGYSGDDCEDFTAPTDRSSVAYLFVQDVCGTDSYLMDSAQGVFSNYLALLKNAQYYLITNAAGDSVVSIKDSSDLVAKMAANRQSATSCDSTMADAIDNFYAVLSKPALASFAADSSVGKANVLHVTTVPCDGNTGSDFKNLQHDFTLTMSVVGLTEKNVNFANTASFNAFSSVLKFSQTYDPEVALLNIVGDLGSDIKPPSVAPDYSRCVNGIQAAFEFHTDISSVPNSAAYRKKTQQVIQSVTKYFSLPTVTTIPMDDDTCEFETQYLVNVTTFTGGLYLNNTVVGNPTFCSSNMESYTKSIVEAGYSPQQKVTLQTIINSYAKWYDPNSPLKMMCHCFEVENPDLTRIMFWTALNPEVNDDVNDVSFAGFEYAQFKHILMPFGFKWGDSPVWQKLIPKENWLGDASDNDYTTEKIVQDIWTKVCRMAGTIDETSTAEPFNAYTTKKTQSADDAVASESPDGLY